VPAGNAQTENEGHRQASEVGTHLERSGPGTNLGASGPGTNPGTSGPGTNPGTSGPGTNPGTSGPGTNPGTSGPGTNPVKPGLGTNLEQSLQPGVTYSLVNSLAETHVALDVCRAVWGADAVRDVDLYFVAATHGGYFGVAWLNGKAVGASFGLLSNGGRGLHSHMAAVLSEHAGSGIGYGLKQHQREWATSQGIEVITWTYDPLVRRNAWFNLVRLGAHVTGYEVNYYGALGDAINGNDESDRLMVSWPVNAESGSTVAPLANDVLVAIPHDIEAIRLMESSTHSGNDQSSQWRLRMRADLYPKLLQSWRLVGLSADYHYVLRRAS
jgi:predicted GNAT superfamily acetyltransferase